MSVVRYVSTGDLYGTCCSHVLPLFRSSEMCPVERRNGQRETTTRVVRRGTERTKGKNEMKVARKLLSELGIGSLLARQIIRFAALPPTGHFWDTRWHLPFSFAVSPFFPLPIERNEKKLFPHRKRYRLGPLSGICRFIRSHFAREALKIRPEILPINPNHPVGEQCSCLSNHNSTLSSPSYPQIGRNVSSRSLERKGLFPRPAVL